MENYNYVISKLLECTYYNFGKNYVKRICAPQAKRENKCQNEQVSVISTELIGYQIQVLQQNNCTVFIMKVQAPKVYKAFWIF